MTPQQVGFALAKSLSHPDPLAFAEAFAANAATADEDIQAAEAAKKATPAPEAPTA